MVQDREKYLNDAIWQLLIECFALEELRNYDVQQSIMLHEEYHTDIIWDKRQAIGMMAWWDLKNMIFVEYIAVDKKSRNQGIASKLIEDLKQRNKPIVLEIKRTIDNEMVKNFYIKKGFCVNDYKYHAMNLRETEQHIKYQLLSYPYRLNILQYLYFQGFIHNPAYKK